MIADLFYYCEDALRRNPLVITINQPLTRGQFINFSNRFANAKFTEQQHSIITSDPEHFGKGRLWHYELVYEDLRNGFRIERHATPSPSARELILLASVTDEDVPFPYSLPVFNTTHGRLMGRDKRAKKLVAASLRPAIAAVHLVCQGSASYLRARPFEDVVTVFQDVDIRFPMG